MFILRRQIKSVLNHNQCKQKHNNNFVIREEDNTLVKTKNQQIDVILFNTNFTLMDINK